MSNVVQWFEIATNDLERAKVFYAAVFQREFTFIEMPDTSMYMFSGEDEMSGSRGALVKSKDNTPSIDGTIVYFQCEDINNEISRIEAAGGKILFPKTSIGQFGFISQFIDTEGNRIGIHSDK
ncbi:MAG: VOC family protein [Chitinophagales bacterium]